MPVIPARPPIPVAVPASLATEPVGEFFAANLRAGTSSAADIGYLLVRVMDLDLPDENRWFSVEAVYNGPTSYGHAIADCQRARRADRDGPYRRLLAVRADGTVS